MAFGMSPFPLRFGSRQGGGGFTPHFWVDSENGDDGNDGTSAEAAFQTLGAAETAALAHGNGVRVGIIGDGAQYRGSMDLSSLSDVQVQGIATTALPIIRGDDIITGDWDDNSDRADAHSNVYSQSYSWESDGSHPCWLGFWDEGRRLAFVADVATCQSTPGSWYMATASTATSSSPQTLYIHPFGSTDPNSDGKTYEGIKRIYGIRLGDSSRCLWVWTKRAGHNNGGLFQGRFSLAERVLSSESVRHQALLESGTQRRVVGWSEAPDSRTGQIHLEYYRGDATGLTGRFVECVAVSDYDTALDSGIGWHASSTEYERLTVEDSLVIGSLIGGIDMNNLDIVRTRVIDGAVLNQVNGTGEATITDCEINIQRPLGTTNRIALQIESAQPTAIDGLRLNVKVDGENWVGVYGAPTAGDVAITESVIVDENTNPGGLKDFIAFLQSTADISIADTIMETRASNPNNNESRIYVGPGSGSYLGSNNVFYPGGVNDWIFNFVGGSEYDGASAYLSAVQPGGEAGSLVEDPSIVDPSGGDFGATTTNGAGIARSVTYLPQSIGLSLDAAHNWVLNGEAPGATELAGAVSGLSNYVDDAGDSSGSWDGTTFANSNAGIFNGYPRLVFTGLFEVGVRYHVRVDFDDGLPILVAVMGNGVGPELTRRGNSFSGIGEAAGTMLMIAGRNIVFSVDVLRVSVRAMPS